MYCQYQEQTDEDSLLTTQIIYSWGFSRPNYCLWQYSV